MLDFVRNSLDDEIRQALTTQADMLQFIKHDLEQPLSIRAPYGYCTDVMEHIPPDRVDRVLGNILLAAQHVFFAIATTPDHCGTLIGEPLHLSVHPAEWWLAKLAAAGCLVQWSEVQPDRLLCYVTAWSTGREVSEKGVLNTQDQQLRANVTHNLQQGWQHVVPHQPTEAERSLECMIVGGGPTLGVFADEITAHRATGMKLITLNGAYNWALAHGLTPSATVVADARAFNARFTHPVVESCRYLIGSHCDPAVLEGLPKDRTWLWHNNPTLIEDLLTQYCPQGWFCIPGGSTVLLRAIPLLAMLGYHRFHLYGCDSCLTDGAHHAYPQPENHDEQSALPVIVNAPGSPGRVFSCAPWMISQATEFIEIIRRMGDAFELQIHGDGLLAHILEVGASATLDTKGD
jgi:hypothetical protein